MGVEKGDESDGSVRMKITMDEKGLDGDADDRLLDND